MKVICPIVASHLLDSLSISGHKGKIHCSINLFGFGFFKLLRYIVFIIAHAYGPFPLPLAS